MAGSSQTDVDPILHCVCMQPNDPTKPMILCDFCNTWFHLTCVHLQDDEAETLAFWHCGNCVEALSSNPSLETGSILSFQGRHAPKEGWTDELNLEDIDENFVNERIKTKRHKIEGWNLFRENKVTSLSTCTQGCYMYVRGTCLPSMKAKVYNEYICFKENGKALKWSYCSRPAGVDGQCKHVAAVFYLLYDFLHQGLSKIPSIKTCTEKLQMWHVNRPLSDEPLLFTDIQFVKHDPTRIAKRDLACSVKMHNPTLDFGRNVKEERIKKLTFMCKNAGIKLPVLETIQSNNCLPSLNKQQAIDISLDLFNAITKTNFDSFQTQAYTTNLPADKLAYCTKLVSLNDETAVQIEKQTRNQSKSAFWFEQRMHRITSSSFGMFCKMRPSTDKVKSFLRTRNFFTSASVRHGIHYEDAAFAQFSLARRVEDSPVGLIVNPQLPFLGASPDRLIKEDGELKLVEIKCPYSLFSKNKKLMQEIINGNLYVSRKGSELHLNDQHDYYYQIQGQLNISGIDICELVIFVPPKDIATVTIHRNKAFFEDNMLPKLANIWYHHLCPFFYQRYVMCNKSSAIN